MRRTIRALSIAALALVAACSSGTDQKKRPPPVVKAVPVESHLFTEVIQSEGTARANEQVTMASNVTERIERVLFEDGMKVARGQLLAVLTQGQEEANLRGATAAEKQAAAQYERVKNLYDRGFATQAQLDLQMAATEKARADAAEAEAAINDRMIRSPFAGYVSLRNISAGAIVSAGTPLVTVSDISRIKLDFTVPETQLAGLAVGQMIDAEAAAYPGEVFRGRIMSIDPVIDPNSRAVMARAILNNPDARLKPGMLLSVTVKRSSRRSDAVPELAVIGNGDERSVFILGPDNKAKLVTVKTGMRENGLIEVTGLPPGTKVISEGALKVSDGMTVSLGNAPGGADKTRQADPRAAPGS